MLFLTFSQGTFHLVYRSFYLSLCLSCSSVSSTAVKPGGSFLDAPVFTVIDCRLSSFMGDLLSCKVTQGSVWEPIYWWHLFRNDLLPVSPTDTQRYLCSQDNPTIIVAWFKHLPFSIFSVVFHLPAEQRAHTRCKSVIRTVNLSLTAAVKLSLAKTWHC